MANGMDISKASVPITAVVAICVAGLGWWVNAQESEIDAVAADVEQVEAKVEDLKDDMQEQKLEVQTKLSDIKTQQALDAQLLRQIARKLDVDDDDG